MSDSLSSFLMSAGIITAVVLLVPCIEFIVRIVRRKPLPVQEPSRAYARKMDSAGR